MSTADVEAGAPATTLDHLALRNLQDYLADELPRIQKRSEKWIAGLAAVTGILTTAVVVKGPASFTDLVESRTILGFSVNPQNVIIGMMLVSGLLIATGVVNAYSAAHGDPLGDDKLRVRALEQQLNGAFKAWTSAVAATTTRTRKSLRLATILTMAGTALLACAVLLTWTTPEESSGGQFTCVRDGSSVVKLDGSAPSVASGELTLVPCP